MSAMGSTSNGDQRTLTSPKDMALTLTVPLGSLYNLVNEGRLPHVHVGRKLCFNRDAVLEWLQLGGYEVQGRFQCPVCAKRKEDRRRRAEK